MKNTIFFIFLIVLILGIIYIFKTSDTPPETGITHTPKEYIETVEEKKAARLQADNSE